MTFAKDSDWAQQILHQISIDDTYRFEVLQPMHIESTVAMFTRAFCDSEPMTRYVNMSYQGFTPFALATVEKASEDRLSIVALDGDRVIACALVEDLTNPLELTFEPDPKFAPIFALLESLNGGFFANKEIQKNNVAHLFITAVDGDYRYRGLSKQINFRAMALAVNEGFSLMVSELTNHYNEEGILHHLQYDKLLLGKIIYNQFIQNGVYPFESLAGGATCYLWELHQKANLIFLQQDKLMKKPLSVFK